MIQSHIFHHNSVHCHNVTGLYMYIKLVYKQINKSAIKETVQHRADDRRQTDRQSKTIALLLTHARGVNTFTIIVMEVADSSLAGEIVSHAD